MTNTTLTDKKYMCLEVGKPYPFPVPDGKEGITFDITGSGKADMYIFYPNQSDGERQSIEAGPTRYALYEYNAVNGITIALLIIKYPAPIGYICMPFHSKLSNPGSIQGYLQKTEDGHYKNIMHITALDKQIVVNCRMIGLDTKLIEQLHRIIRKQLNQDFNIQSYDIALEESYRYSLKELFERTKSYPILKKIHMDAGIFL